jgi:hypothetical protein
MNSDVRIKLSWGAITLAVLHAIAMVGGFYAIHEVPQTAHPQTQASLIDQLPSAYPSGYQYQTLPQPQVTAPPVNRSALDEIKQQAPVSQVEQLKGGRWIRNNNTGEMVWCNSCGETYVTPPRYTQPVYVQPQPQPVYVPAPQPQPAPILPGTTRTLPASNSVLPAPKIYELALFVGTDARSQQLLNWFNTDPSLAKVKAASNYQVYTRDNPLYKTRFASVVPPEQFPAVVLQHADGGHIHAAGGNFIPTSAQQLFSDFQQGVTHSKQVREHDRQMTGMIRQAGYSWDRGIAPNMQLPSLQQLQQYGGEPESCDPNDPNCGRRWPGGGGGGGLDGLWNKPNQALFWFGPNEMVIGILALAAVGLIVLIITKKR